MRSPTASDCRADPRPDRRQRRRDPVLALHGAGAVCAGPGLLQRRGDASSARAGDFVTAPELGPIFAACVAESVAPVLQQLGARRAVLRARRRQRRVRRSRAEAAARTRCAARSLPDPRTQRGPAPAPARAPAAAADAAAVRAGGVAGRSAADGMGWRAVRQRSDRRACRRRASRSETARCSRSTWSWKANASRARSGPPMRSSATRCAISSAVSSAASRTATAPKCCRSCRTGSRPCPAACARRDAVRRLRPSARRVLPARSQRRHAARVLPPSHARRAAAVAGPAGPDRVGGLHRAGRSRRGGGLRLRRLLLAGQLPARQWHGRRARTHRAHARRQRAAAPPQRSEEADPAQRDGRTLPGDGLRRRTSSSAPPSSPAT